MATAIAIGFPFGRYHATPWHRAVNEGEVDWPPSPWRILRALISTRHERWPELPDDRLDALISQLAAGSPSYRLPPYSFAHTRHYLPDLAATSASRSSDLVLDPFAWMQPGATVVVRWDVDLNEQARADLGRLCQLVPYLGRSESISDWELLAVAPDPDKTWSTPGETAAPTVRLLQPDPTVTRRDLEVTSM